MELPEIEKAIKEFEAKLKPIAKGQTTLTQEEIIPEAVPGYEPGMCFNLPFKQLIVALEEAYIGENNAKLWLLQQPDCVEVTT